MSVCLCVSDPGLCTNVSLAPPTGQASSASAESAGQLAEQMADLAWDFATKEGFRVFNAMPGGSGGAGAGQAGGPSQRRGFSTWTGGRGRSFSSAPPTPAPPPSEGALIFSPAGLPPRVQHLHLLLENFLLEHILPVEQRLRDHQASPQRWSPPPIIEELKVTPPPPRPRQMNHCFGFLDNFLS